jgi:hypothetical protein
MKTQQICYCKSNGSWILGCPEFKCSDPKFYGLNCEEECFCSGGKCNQFGECGQCFENYSGPKCDKCECKNGGTCQGDKCLCTEDFNGILCETRLEKCTNGLYDNNSKNCVCPEVYRGVFCETYQCQNNGTCDSDGCDCPPLLRF